MGSYLIASCEFSGKLIKVDVASQKVVGALALPDGREVCPQDVKLSPDGRIFYVADMMSNGVWEVDGDKLTTRRFHPTRARARTASTRAGTPASSTFRNRGDGTISVISFRTRRVVATWHIPGGSPDMGGVSADGKVLWLSGRYNSEVYAINTRTGQLIARIPVGAGRTVSRLAAAGPLLAGTHRDPSLSPVPIGVAGCSQANVRQCPHPGVMTNRTARAAALVAALALTAGCGGTHSSTPAPTATPATTTTTTATSPTTTQTGGATTSASPGALQAEANAAAAGDIPDNQVFLRFENSRAAYAIKYPEGWAQQGAGNNVTFRDKNNIVRVVITPGPAPTSASVRTDVAHLGAAAIEKPLRRITVAGKPAFAVTTRRRARRTRSPGSA